MTPICKRLFLFVGKGIALICLYPIIVLILLLISICGLHSGYVFKTYPLNEFQKIYYFSGGRNSWHHDPRCVEASDHLIYRPRPGTCEFANPEFKTLMNFDQHGRIVPGRNLMDQRKKGIVVLGDSHAMGWGVSDEQTFANVLQQITLRPVYNLGVASYGTERELRLLSSSEILDIIDTIIIQYCNNDLEENKSLLSIDDYRKKAEEFKYWLNRGRPTTFSARGMYLSTLVWRALVRPLNHIKSSLWGVKEKELDFSVHIPALQQALGRYERYLTGKKVILIYINGNGVKFKNFPEGKDPRFPGIRFFRDSTETDDYYYLDDHLNSLGHKKIGEALGNYLLNESSLYE